MAVPPPPRAADDEPGRPITPERPGVAVMPLVLAIAMEAAWVSAVSGLVQEFALRPPTVGLAGMVAFVAAGVILARLVGARIPHQWPALGTGLVLLAAVGGVLAAPASGDALLAGQPGRALALNPGGLLAGLALLRGFPHAGDRLAVDTAARALFIGIPLLAVSAAAGGMVAEPFRSEYLRDAGIDAAVFIASGLLTLAASAMADVRPAGTAPWRANPVWIGLVALAVVALLGFAVPVALAGGPSIVLTLQVLVAASLFPLALVGFVIGGRAALRRLAFIVGGTAVVVWILSFAGRAGSNQSLTGSGAGGGSTINPTTISPAGAIGISTVAILVAGVVVFLLIRAWMRRTPALPDELVDVRSSDVPAAEEAQPAVRRGRRRPWSREPRTAVEAYLALVEEIHDVPDVRRKAAETPAEHARRIRLDQLSADEGIGLELLAADYGLAAFGRRSISDRETRRAIGRWRTLRRLLRTRIADAPARRSRADDDEPPDLMKPSRSN